ncbi:hypothetical protein H6P81_013566 [Aristolochia fimbriata]|uniref:Uncharacterized protein n=1 Tax=Aristolochia fimbriata TaxID=158543 RepID=A0AAV7EJP9_ARIFI|nr:hypothetical protein H6P81_013566 [Aristolochia fimbriata]
MGEVAAGVFFKCQQRLSPSGDDRGTLSEYYMPNSGLRVRNSGFRTAGVARDRNNVRRQCARRNARGNPVMSLDAGSNSGKMSTFCSCIATDLPLQESSGASFDEYLEDRSRVFRAMFPEENRSRRLNEEEWRIQMLPLDFLFLSVRPVVDMRLRSISHAEDYPPGIPQTVNRVLHLKATRWELRGLDSMVKPTHFALGVQGTLYSHKHGPRSRLKGHLEMSISCILPPALALVPQDVLKNVSESVLRRLVENMKQKVDQSLVSDFGSFRRERLRAASSQSQSVSPSTAVDST